MAEIVNGVVISLSRNIREYPFPVRLDRQAKIEVSEKVADVLSSYDEKFEMFDISELDSYEIPALLDSFYISQKYADDVTGKILFVSEDKKLVLFTNGENHIKIVAVEKGLDFDTPYARIDRLDDYISEKLPFAFSKEYGYLCADPDNLGTGLKATSVMHLGSLDRNRAVSRISSNLSKLGLIIKPLYSDNVRPFGDMYTLTNNVSMGISEKAAIENLKNITEQLVSQETESMKNYVSKIENMDRIYRSWGILTNARIMGYAESLDLLSNIRMGVISGLIEGGTDRIDQLINDVQPVNILKTFGDDAYDDMDEKRAGIIRDALAK